MENNVQTRALPYRNSFWVQFCIEVVTISLDTGPCSPQQEYIPRGLQSGLREIKAHIRGNISFIFILSNISFIFIYFNGFRLATYRAFCFFVCLHISII